MDLETACYDLREPGVIDEKLLYSVIIEQGPKGEEGRLFKQQGIVYEEITQIRLEFLNILKIDHLWMLTGLTKLQLSNNAIEKIENLESLVNLKELDLSFNFIEKIENLDALLGLEVLSLYQNKIEVLENLHHLSSLTVFSVGNNKINNYENILYLRSFESLKSFNMAGNPICEDENFTKFIMAYLPQLVYYEYRMITKSERDECREFFLKDLIKLEREEAELKEIQLAQKEEEKREALNAEAFVEYLGGPQLFMSMFEKDFDCKTLLQMGDNVMDIYNDVSFVFGVSKHKYAVCLRWNEQLQCQTNEAPRNDKNIFANLHSAVTEKYISFKKNFLEVTAELHRFGLEQLELRKAEVARFNKYTGKAKEKAFKESREIVEDFLEQKNALFAQIKEVLNTDVEDEDTANEVSLNVQVINEAFKDLCHRTWTVLMKKELHLFEATEEVNGTYDRALNELVNQFIEGCQAQFTQLRQLQNAFNEALTDSANKFFTNYTVATATGHGNEYKNLSNDLVNILQDKELLTNALSASHDYHLLIIDQREDKLVSGVRTWLSNLVGDLVSSEINRNRRSVTEINHFLDTQKNELQEILSTPVGLLLLPKEIQDALQI